MSQTKTNAASQSPRSLTPGSIARRPSIGSSQAHAGVSPLHPINNRNTSFQPLPRPLGLPPYHYDITEHFPNIGTAMNAAGKMIFHVVGDSGGINNGQFQHDVAAEMIAALDGDQATRPLFCYHVGDVVYFNGEKSDYYAQFYEPYAHYDAPILAIPGNHDGEIDDPSEGTSLDGWVEYFMQEHPDVDPLSKDAPRVQMNLPNVYWTLITPLATIVGLYTNVPEHGSIDSTQQQWLTNEFATADKAKPLIFALHHPIYSFDVFHSGSSKMADVLENAIRDTGRIPNMVLSGHVHDYQRIEQEVAPGVTIPFIVTGNGGYLNLHAVHSQPGDVATDSKAVLKYACANGWGFMTLTIDHNTISLVTKEIDRNGNAKDGDSASYSAKPIIIADGKSVNTL